MKTPTKSSEKSKVPEAGVLTGLEAPETVSQGNGLDEAVKVLGPIGQVNGSSEAEPQSNGSAAPPSTNGSDLAPAKDEIPKPRFEVIENEIAHAKRESVFRNLEALKIEPDEDDDETGEPVLSNCPLRRPGKRAFRAHPDDKYQFESFVLENPKEKISHYIMPEAGKVLIDQKIENFKHTLLVLCINKSGNLFFWPIPAKGGFRTSGLKAVDMARDFWIKAVGDLEAGGYQIEKMLQSEYGEPAWPAIMPSLEELLELAFGDNIISDINDPVVKRAKNV